MKNIGDMLKKAQEMQTKMAEMQEKVMQMEVTGSSGGGMVKVTLSGKGAARKVSIDPSLADDVTVIEDLLVAAFNDAQRKVEELLANEMSEMKGGLNLPFNHPF